MNSFTADLRATHPFTKVLWVLLGYVLAVVVAYGVVALYTEATQSYERVQSEGMYGWGDMLLFLAVWGIASVPPTGFGLYFLRPYRLFWVLLSIGALLAASTAVASTIVDMLAGRSAPAGSVLEMWNQLAFLRIAFTTPLCALAFFVCGAFAPSLGARIALLLASGIEAAAFARVFLIMLASRA